MNARRFQITHPLSGMRSSLDASKDIAMGNGDLALTCGSEPVVGPACSCILEASSDREDRSLDVCYVGDTR